MAKKKRWLPSGPTLFSSRAVPCLAFFLTLGAAVAKTLVETVNTTTAIENLLLAGKERVTV
jgi:hypothetical protein